MFHNRRAIRQYNNRPQQPQPIQQPQPQPIIQQPIQQKREEIDWGEPIWTLLHTLSCKIREEYFAIKKEELLQNVVRICTNLPCPTCSNHAREYLNQYLNLQYIRTKEDLKNFFFHFHQMVNIRKHYALYNRENLEADYQQKSTVDVFNRFYVAYLKNYQLERDMVNSMFRRSVAILVKDWFKNNLYIFEP
jgi:hypothetical protein